MNAQEAIKILQNEAECIRRAGCSDNCREREKQCSKCDLVMEVKDIAAALNMAIEALAKLPEAQKTSWEVEPYPKHMNEGVKAPYCPVCGQDLLNESNDCFNYCPDCGQRIDWS